MGNEESPGVSRGISCATWPRTTSIFSYKMILNCTTESRPRARFLLLECSEQGDTLGVVGASWLLGWETGV